MIIFISSGYSPRISSIHLFSDSLTSQNPSALIHFTDTGLTVRRLVVRRQSGQRIYSERPQLSTDDSCWASKEQTHSHQLSVHLYAANVCGVCSREDKTGWPSGEKRSDVKAKKSEREVKSNYAYVIERGPLGPFVPATLMF